MFFSVKPTLNNPIISKGHLYLSARRRIILFPFGSNEIALNKYLIGQLNMGLKQVCLKLFNDCLWNTDENGEIIITFRTKQSDKLASLITYGDGKLQGSSILKFAFHRDE